MDFYIVLARPGFRVSRRKRLKSRLGLSHRSVVTVRPCARNRTCHALCAMIPVCTVAVPLGPSLRAPVSFPAHNPVGFACRFLSPSPSRPRTPRLGLGLVLALKPSTLFRNQRRCLGCSIKALPLVLLSPCCWLNRCIQDHQGGRHEVVQDPLGRPHLQRVNATPAFSFGSQPLYSVRINVPLTFNNPRCKIDA